MKPFDIIKKASALTDSVLVSLSLGKDSLAVLDLCSQYFKRVEAFFLYFIKDLSFQQKWFDYIERRYGIKTNLIPLPETGNYFRNGIFRDPTSQSSSIPSFDLTEAENYARQMTGISWIASGVRATDSLHRRGMISSTGGGVDEKKYFFYPIAYWNNSAVYNYLKLRKIPLPHDYLTLRRNTSVAFSAPHLRFVKNNYPADYLKILEVFPYAEAVLKREEVKRNHEVPEVRGGDDPEK